MKALFLSFLVVLSTQTFAQFAIGHRTITYNDPSRNNRAIACEIYYPALVAGENTTVETDQFPVIIFGHGFVMQPGAYVNWKDEFVPEGYILVFPATETGASPNHEQFGLDLRFLTTQMQAEGADISSPFHQHVSERSAIMGHSMGGGATFLAASNFADVDCIVGLAPAETNPSAVSAAAAISAPTLILSGTSDGVTPPADHHIPIYNGVGSDCKYFVNIQNGSHCRFASNPGLCSLGEFIPGTLSAADQQAVSYAVCHPWFNYFLKDDCDAWDDFQTALSTQQALGTIESDCANDAPIITDNAGTLESNLQPNYQWYLDGNEIPNETAQTHIYTQAGTYQVVTVILGNCPMLSNQIVVQPTGLTDAEIGMTLVGNTIQLHTHKALNNIVVEWFDVSGKLIATQAVNSTRSDGIISISKPVFSGIKLLRLRSNETTIVLKVRL